MPRQPVEPACSSSPSLDPLLRRSQDDRLAGTATTQFLLAFEMGKRLNQVRFLIERLPELYLERRLGTAHQVERYIHRLVDTLARHCCLVCRPAHLDRIEQRLRACEQACGEEYLPAQRPRDQSVPAYSSALQADQQSCARMRAEWDPHLATCDELLQTLEPPFEIACCLGIELDRLWRPREPTKLPEDDWYWPRWQPGELHVPPHQLQWNIDERSQQLQSLWQRVSSVAGAVPSGPPQHRLPVPAKSAGPAEGNSIDDCDEPADCVDRKDNAANGKGHADGDVRCADDCPEYVTTLDQFLRAELARISSPQSAGQPSASAPKPDSSAIAAAGPQVHIDPPGNHCAVAFLGRSCGISNPDTARWLKRLIERNGQWLAKGDPAYVPRPGQHRDKLPDQLQPCIEIKKGRGARWRPEAWQALDASTDLAMNTAHESAASSAHDTNSTVSPFAGVAGRAVSAS